MSEDSKDKTKIKSWYTNRYQIVVVQRNILLLFTIISMFSVAISVIFVKSIMSSKSLEPYVVEIEEKTGIATVVKQLSSENFTGDQVMRKYFVNKYIRSASGYDPKTYKQDAEEVRLFSLPAVYNEFKSRINPRELGADSKINVRVKSVQFQDSNNALIRINRQITSDKSTQIISKDEVATISFFFAPEVQLSMEERMINPLGFQVNKYTVTEEIFSY